MAASLFVSHQVMKNLALIALLSLMAAPAFSAVSKDFYSCEGLGGVDEYRVGIDLKTNKAGFFDNDTTSVMKLTDVNILESLPPQTQMIFEGKEASYAGTLKLYFNLTRKTASLYSINTKGKQTKI